MAATVYDLGPLILSPSLRKNACYLETSFKNGYFAKDNLAIRISWLRDKNMLSDKQIRRWRWQNTCFLHEAWAQIPRVGDQMQDNVIVWMHRFNRIIVWHATGPRERNGASPKQSATLDWSSPLFSLPAIRRTQLTVVRRGMIPQFYSCHANFRPTRKTDRNWLIRRAVIRKKLSRKNVVMSLPPSINAKIKSLRGGLIN